jgi:O-antigen ligase
MIGIGILGIIQFLSGHPHSDPTPEIFSHFRTYQTTIGLGLTHSVTSNLSMAVFPLIAAILLKPDFLKTLFESKTLQSRWFWSCVAISIIFVISMVFARSAWLTLPIGFAFLLLMGLSKKRALIAITAVVGLAILAFQLPAIRDRMNSQTGHEDRIVIWMGNIEFFKINFFFGVGWRQSSKLVDGAARYYYSSRGENLPTVFFPGHAHSVYLEMLSTTGALGLLMFLVWSSFVFVTAWRARNDFDYGWWVKGFLAALTVIYLNGIIQVNFWDSKVLHQIMLQCGLLFSIVLNRRSEELA